MADPITPTADESRRKSGRVVQKPTLYNEDPDVQPTTASGKRKRGGARATPDANGAGDGDAPDAVDSDEDEEEDEDESEPDEEERAELRRRARARKSKSKPAAKKPKVNKDSTLELAMRPAANGVKKITKSKPRKPRANPAKRSGSGIDTGSGLYKEVFAEGKSSAEVATRWLASYNEEPVHAMRDFVNFVLKCTGCSFEIDADDIEDVDNVAGKLTDLQDEYTAQQVTEYPLIAKAKDSVFSRPVMVAFVETLLEAAHQTERLYEDVALIENMQVWVTTMTSSSSRPFQHTAAVIGLAMNSALCSLNRQMTETIATTSRQRDAEAKRKSANKQRVKAIQDKIKEAEARLAQIETWIKEIFDGIFVHRYRDVDPRIRVDCASTLGSWIAMCPDIFFLGEYLRYLGWVLSDVIPSTRLECVKQLLRLYDDPENAGRLRAFTERFKGRMVEMAAQDADPAVRAAAIDLLENIREMGFLEPEDIDSVGKLIFDSEPRVRKAVEDFFAANIDDTVEATLEEVGGAEVLNEALGEEDDTDFTQPKRSWLKFKCLAEVLEAYDADDADVAEAVALGADNLIDTGGGTRFSLAGEVACSGIEEMKEWESLAGYLLYDFSIPKGQASKDPIYTFKGVTAPSEKQESILLEVLQVAVRAQIDVAVAAAADRKGKPKVKTDDSKAMQESIALSLGNLLPKLLSKFGSNPSTVIAVLRLEQLLNLGVFQELRSGSDEFSGLLDDISRQFMTHADSNVLKAARDSLLHARAADDYNEVTDTKVEEVWEDVLKALRQAACTSNPDTSSLVNTVQRISYLAGINDCVGLFELEIPGNKRKPSPATNAAAYLQSLLVGYQDALDEDGEQILLGAMQALLLYTLWKVKHTRDDLESGNETDWDLGPLAGALTLLIEARPKLDGVRITAIGTLLDAYSAQISLRQIGSDDAEVTDAINRLVANVPADAKKAITATFVAAEKDFAKKAKKNLDQTPDDAEANDRGASGEAEAPESESEESEDEDDGDEQQKKHEALMAERRLCELTGKIVLAVVGKVLDAEAPGKGKLRRRILKNKTKLGPHFKEVLGYLEDPKAKTKAPRRAKTPTEQTNGPVATTVGAKSTEFVEEIDNDDDEGGHEAEAPANEDGVEGDEEDLKRRGVAMDKDDIVNEVENEPDEEEDEMMEG